MLWFAEPVNFVRCVPLVWNVGMLPPSPCVKLPRTSSVPAVNFAGFIAAKERRVASHDETRALEV